ncbi:6-pyruvoyl trahydropterin synthase family protein [Thermogutta sp.]|uniref:6-pyruvoyl trahydropterin synthase family protein n=1 Tax=Thermogutta sp. TaxID=1962930 RepID=UPI003C7E713E
MVRAQLGFPHLLRGSGKKGVGLGEDFAIRIGRGTVQFSAAHFLVFGPDSAEAIHGHDFTVEVVVAGNLREPGWVMDFLVLHRLIREVVEPFDHKLLLPAKNSWLRVEILEHDVIRASLEKWTWQFPAANCVLLPLCNVTAELLARHIGANLKDRIEAQFPESVERLAVEVFETPHYSAQWIYSRQDGESRC